MQKQLKNFLKGLLRRAERRSMSLTALALARALRAARVVRLLPVRYVDGELELEGLGYIVELKGRPGILLHYFLEKSWGSPEYNHTEEGLAFFDQHTGTWLPLLYWGQHAGDSEFASAFPGDRLKALGGPVNVLELAKRPFQLEQLGVGWAPRLAYPKPGALQRRRHRALDELAQEAEALGLYE